MAMSLKEKNVAKPTFKNFNQMIQNQSNVKIQVLQTNNKKEYFNTILRNYLLEKRIMYQSSCIDTPRQNGVVK